MGGTRISRTCKPIQTVNPPSLGSGCAGEVSARQQGACWRAFFCLLISQLIAGQVVQPSEPWIRQYLGLPAAGVESAG